MGKLIKFLIRAVVTVALILSAGLVSTYYFRNDILKWALPKLALSKLGVELRLKSIRVEPGSGILECHGLWIGHPQSHSLSEPMLIASRIYVDLEGALWPGRSITVESALLDVDRLVVVRNASGDISWKTLGTKPKAGLPAPPPDSPRRRVRIDRLDLSLKELRWVDRKIQPELDLLIPLHIDHLILRSVTDEDVVDRIVSEILKSAKGKFLKDILDQKMLAVPDPLLKGTEKALDKLRGLGKSMKDKLGL